MIWISQYITFQTTSCDKLAVNYLQSWGITSSVITGIYTQLSSLHFLTPFVMHIYVKFSKGGGSLYFLTPCVIHITVQVFFIEGSNLVKGQQRLCPYIGNNLQRSKPFSRFNIYGQTTTLENIQNSLVLLHIAVQLSDCCKVLVQSQSQLQNWE